MSRRKQSNPKPLKRSSAEILLDTAQLLCLPQDVLTLKSLDSEDDEESENVYESFGLNEEKILRYVVFSKRSIAKDTLFGPYKAECIDEVKCSEDGSTEDDTWSNKIEPLNVKLGEENGNWLKILRTADTKDEINATIIIKSGKNVFCKILDDIESPSELKLDKKINFIIYHNEKSIIESENESSNSVIDEADEDEDDENDDDENDDDDDDGDDNSQPKEQKEKNDLNHIDLELIAMDDDCQEALICRPCGITFSSKVTLTAHQKYYCINKLRNEDKNSETSLTLNDKRKKRIDSKDIITRQKVTLKMFNHRSDHERDMTSDEIFYEQDKTTGFENLDEHEVNSECGEELDNSSNDNDAFNSEEEVKLRKQENESPSASGLDEIGEDKKKDGSKYRKSGNVYKCKQCSYLTDKKALLLKHIKALHNLLLNQNSPKVASSVNTDESEDSDFQQSVSPQDRYCSACDIQFSSYKTYKVHKQFYCGSRHGSSKSLHSGDSMRKNHKTERLSESESERCSINKSELETGIILNNNHANQNSSSPQQPIYIAISTNPLILVPMSLNSEASGSNIIKLSENSQLASRLNGLLAQGCIDKSQLVTSNGNGNSNSSNTNNSSNSNNSTNSNNHHLEAHRNSITNNNIAYPSNPTGLITESDRDDQPLDLSSHKSSSRKLLNTDKLEFANDNDNTRQSNSIFNTPNFSDSLPLQLNLNTSHIVPILSLAPDMVFKQGAYNCETCHIVFYKQENYIVHKRHYCSSRLPGTAAANSSSSPESRENDLIADSPENTLDSSKYSHTRRVSPYSNPNSSPPIPSSSPNSNQTLSQFYCVACGIRFTSLDNLQAHQTYYCLKRSSTSAASATLNENKPNFLSSSQNSETQNEISCVKCKKTYGNEELFLAHACSSLNLNSNSSVKSTSSNSSALNLNSTSSNSIQCLKCTICGYKGHTMRGMRTHVRIHQDKIQGAPEESFIACFDESSIVKNQRNTSTTRRRISLESYSHPFSSFHSDNSKSILATSNNIHNSNLSLDPLSENEDVANMSDSELIREGFKQNSNEALHNCQYCFYSSTYKGNVVRHIKLVHKDVGTGSPASIKLKREGVENDDTASYLNEPSQSENDHPLDLQTVRSSKNVSSLAVVTSSVSNASSTASSVNSLPCPALGQAKKVVPKYCRSCDISFQFLTSFIAHKKYYCSSHSNEVSMVQVLAENKSPV